MFNIRQSSLVRQLLFSFVVKEERPAFLARLNRLRKMPAVQEWESRLRPRASSPLDVDVRVAPIQDQAGGPVAFRWLLRDITARKRAEEEIHVLNAELERRVEERTAQIRFQARLLDAVEQAVIATDLEGIIMYWNRCAETLYGWPAAEAIGQPATLITPDDMPQAQATEIMAYLRAGETWAGEFRVRHRDGRIFPVLVTNSPIYDAAGKMIGMIGVSQDITERKQTEETLRATEQRFRAIFDGVHIGVAVDNLEGRPIETNQVLQKMLGYSGEELRATHFSRYTHPDDVAADCTLFDELVAGKRDSYQLEKRYIRKDRSLVWANLTVSLIRDPEGRPQFAIGIVEDITERKRVADDLAEAQRRRVEIQEAERLHLARELHDSTVQQLLGISYQLVAARRRAVGERHGDGPDSDGLVPVLEATRQEVLSVVTQLRGLIGGLRPAGLEEFGLTAALEGYVARLQREGSAEMPAIECELAASGTLLPQPVAFCLFRAAQEALRNALQHAAAQRIVVALSLPSGEAVLRVSDDGRGFKVPARLSMLARSDHFGLIGIAERVAVAGGQISIRSQPGAGTEVTVRIPLNETEREV
jgi:PAS domain S-box-containing protein